MAAWTDWRTMTGVVAVWLCAATAVSAQPTLFTSRSQWQAAAGPVNTITFEGIAPSGSFTTFDTPSGLPLQGVRFIGASPLSAQTNYLRVVDAAYSTGFNWGSGAVLHGPPEVVGPQGEGGPGAGLVANVYAGITWFGADVMSFASYGSQIAVTVILINGTQYPFTVSTPAYPQRGFVGFVSTTPIFSVRFVGKTGFPTLDNVSLGGPTAIGPPTLAANVSGSTATFNWTPAAVSAPVSGYVFEAATSSFGPAIVAVPVNGTFLVAPNVPNGTYYARVRGVNGAVNGPSSNEVKVVVGSCASPPNPPSGLNGSAAGGVITLAWTPPGGGCAPAGYLVRAGTGPELSNVGVFPVGTATAIQASAPPGTYYIAVLAQNAAGVSAPSNEVQVAVAGCTIPAAPTGFVATSALDVVTLAWQPPAGPISRYLLEIGSATGLANLGVSPVGVPGLQVAGVPRGTYFVRVRAENSCGVGPASVERMLTVTY